MLARLFRTFGCAFRDGMTFILLVGIFFEVEGTIDTSCPDARYPRYTTGPGQKHHRSKISYYALDNNCKRIQS